MQLHMYMGGLGEGEGFVSLSNYTLNLPPFDGIIASKPLGLVPILVPTYRKRHLFHHYVI